MRAATLARSAAGRRVLRAARAAFVIAVLAWLAYRLSGIGWEEVWESRPRTPWFYVAWLGLYLQLPLVEALIFRAAWGLPLRSGLLPLLQKRTLNQDVVSGLGEAFTFVWARRRLSLTDGRIAGTLKDNVIASSLASWISIVLLVLCAGNVLLEMGMAERAPLLLVITAAGTFLILALGVRFRRSLFTLPPRTVLVLTAVHFGRILLLAYLLQIVQWWVVEPAAPLRLWAVMLLVTAVVARIPFLPVRDLVGIGAVLGLMSLPDVYEATIAAMLLARSALDKLCNLAVAAIYFGGDRATRRQDSPDPAAAVPGSGAEARAGWGA
jgi:hypothetical protein